MTVIDLSAETGFFEVAVFCYLSGDSQQETYSVDTDRGHGRVTVYETTSQDKAIGVAEYLEQTRRTGQGEGGEFFTREGTPYDGHVWHWDH